MGSMTEREEELADALNELALDIACTSEAKGFWDHSQFGDLGLVPTKLALINSEVSEALEEYRKALDPVAPEEDPADATDCAEIPLYSADGLLQGYALVDEADWDDLTRFAWRVDTRGYVVRRGGGTVYLHRYLLGLEVGDKAVVDHINGNPLDNRRGNLRAVRREENPQNRHVTFGPSSYRGVSWDSGRALWRATCTYEGKTYHLGHYEDEREAAAKAAQFRCDNMPFSTEATQLRLIREGLFVEELADVVIRSLDLAGYYGFDIGKILVGKMNKNRDRPVKHGKRF